VAGTSKALAPIATAAALSISLRNFISSLLRVLWLSA
jgi:hypothetical protein